MAVEVGLVVGKMAATTPTGTPISTTLSSGNSRKTPTVLMPAHAPRKPIRRQQVLDVLVLGVAVARLLDGHFGQPPGVGARGGGHRSTTRVHPLLGIFAVLQPGPVRFFNFGANLLDGQEVFVFQHARYFLRTPPGEGFLDFLVRAGDHVDGHQLADPPGRRRPCVRGGLDRADVAANRHADQARAHELLARQHHVGRLDHGVGGFDRAHQTLCFNQAEGLHFSSNSGEIITLA